MRAALGAGRGRLLRQLLTESTLARARRRRARPGAGGGRPRRCSWPSPRASPRARARSASTATVLLLHARRLGADRHAVRRAAGAAPRSSAARALKGETRGRRRPARPARCARRCWSSQVAFVLHAADRRRADAAQLLRSCRASTPASAPTTCSPPASTSTGRSTTRTRRCGVSGGARSQGRGGSRGELGRAQLLDPARAVASLQPALPDRGPADRGGRAAHARLPSREPALLRDDRTTPRAGTRLRGRRRARHRSPSRS